MKVIIIGGSIAGSLMALSLSNFCEVTVYEKKSRNEVYKKVCGNICTSSIEKYSHELGLNEKFILNRYDSLKVFTENNSATFQTKEIEIDRKKLLNEIINKSEKNGVSFKFSTSFQSINEKNRFYEVIVRNKNNLYSDKAEIVIGADGATSEFAKRSGLFQNKDFFLFLQTKVKKIKNTKFTPEKNSYYVFLNKEFGYYAYIASSKNGKELKIGLGDDYESNVSLKFKHFLNFLGIKKSKIEGALIPFPQPVKSHKNLHLIGDASCSVKYSGGGIVPIFEQVISLRDKILFRKVSKLSKFKQKILFNKNITHLIKKMENEDFDELLEILKDKKFEKIFSFRDDLEGFDLLRMVSPKIINFLVKTYVKR